MTEDKDVNKLARKPNTIENLLRLKYTCLLICGVCFSCQ